MSVTSRVGSSRFVCERCGKEFSVPAAVLAKYPGWKPKSCMSCKGGSARGGRASSREENRPVAEVLEKFSSGPKDGVFTDGAADPNPGPGGWGAVYVVENRIVEERHGHEPHTTNNRMELLALIAGCRLVPPGTPAVLYTDSQLCVNTVNLWAAGWEKRGWRRKEGEVKNVELVKELYGTLKARPELSVRWIEAHSGHRWNEYADALATAYRRKTR